MCNEQGMELEFVARGLPTTCSKVIIEKLTIKKYISNVKNIFTICLP